MEQFGQSRTSSSRIKVQYYQRIHLPSRKFWCLATRMLIATQKTNLMRKTTTSAHQEQRPSMSIVCHKSPFWHHLRQREVQTSHASLRITKIVRCVLSEQAVGPKSRFIPGGNVSTDSSGLQQMRLGPFVCTALCPTICAINDTEATRRQQSRMFVGSGNAFHFGWHQREIEDLIRGKVKELPQFMQEI